MVPQYSVDPKVMPDETRWKFFRKQIENFRFRAVDHLPIADTRVVVMHGSTPDELRHALRFPAKPGYEHFIIPGHDHNLARALQERGVLKPLMRLAILGKGRKLREMIREIGGMSRADFDTLQTETLKKGTGV